MVHVADEETKKKQHPHFFSALLHCPPMYILWGKKTNRNRGLSNPFGRFYYGQDLCDEADVDGYSQL